MDRVAARSNAISPPEPNAKQKEIVMRTRRQFLGSAVSGIALACCVKTVRSIDLARSRTESSPDEAAKDEAFWATVRSAFTIDAGRIWFNNLAFNPSPAPVHEAFLQTEREVNAWPLAHLRDAFGAKKREALKARLARLINALPEEIALTRNTTEALVNVIFGLELNRGDEVVITDQDYGTFLDAWAQRERREGIVVRKIATPIPARSSEELIETFRRGMTPRTRVVMFSHISSPTGQIFPARAIAEIAHAAGAQVIADAALSVGCMPVDVKEMNCDYLGTSLHKGIFAHTGTGLLYVKRERIRSLWPLFGAGRSQDDDIRKFENHGTSPVTAFATIDRALDFHEAIGTERIAARYRYLKRTWADRLVGHPRCRFNVRLDPEHSCGISTIAIDGTEPPKVYEYLLQTKRVSTWPIRAFPSLWVSPYPFTTPAELDALVLALSDVAEGGLRKG
jgi:isopenicillin-N epimerase